MSRPPDPLALFSLVPAPGCELAVSAVAHPDNARHVSTFLDGSKGLDVGFHIHGNSSTTLATLGRGTEADIYIEGANIAKIQCSFELDLENDVVMLYDRSFTQSTQVFGPNSMPFERERIRKILVQYNLNTILGMGGERRNLYKFQLKWYRNVIETAEVIRKYSTLPWSRMENPRRSRTIDMTPIDLPSHQLKMRYVRASDNQLGSGQFGTVYKVIDVDSGKLMALKTLNRPTKPSEQQKWQNSVYYALKREVEIISQIRHPHIVNYIASQNWDEQIVEIFMGLKEGTLESLIGSGIDPLAIADLVFPQMLQALDCIASKGIIHRDVKPENILYISHPNDQYQFQLGDFGLCNLAVTATSHVGSKLYMAPEMFQKDGRQTFKLDVWALFVTILWTVDEEFRLKSTQFETVENVYNEIRTAASLKLSKIQEMAIMNPEERASAAQMLVKRYRGEGLSTPCSQIPALPSSPPLATTATLTRLLPPPALATQIRQPGRGLQNATGIGVTVRGERACNPLPTNPFRQL
ncbi:hypothetical protein B7494_g7893 [Chlorociboria aeruginascens]|nr:hypothetical protein B7494_g7893 [Chlorociboria aeruginascens]